MTDSPGPVGMRPVYTVEPAHQGIINRFLILENGGPIVGEYFTESEAITSCDRMNERAGKR
jgi:hypothetical protein